MTNSNQLLCTCLALTLAGGCLRPNRAVDPARSYVLSPLSLKSTEAIGAGRDFGLGIAPVELPSYLLENRIVLRNGTSEVRYSENHRWAERLDKGLQRVLAENLAVLLDSDRVLLSAWRRRDVQAELHLAVQRFDCDDRGQVVVDARWRIAAPGGETTLLSRHSHIMRQTSGARSNITPRLPN